jgi:hypothetical protein
MNIDMQTAMVLSKISNKPFIEVVPCDGPVVALAGIIMPLRVFACCLGSAIDIRCANGTDQHNIEKLIEFARRHDLPLATPPLMRGALKDYQDAIRRLLDHLRVSEEHPKEALIELIEQIDADYSSRVLAG